MAAFKSTMKLVWKVGSVDIKDLADSLFLIQFDNWLDKRRNRAWGKRMPSQVDSHYGPWLRVSMEKKHKNIETSRPVPMAVEIGNASDEIGLGGDVENENPISHVDERRDAIIEGNDKLPFKIDGFLIE
ncbi:unnamed protein product [Ilex paraguariensis]|uniref:Uncharacterized protein n=1 Tax=Ilex paraguariensis TaxID=185542 RepID=A0ABC8R7K1_9AQUA